MTPALITIAASAIAFLAGAIGSGVVMYDRGWRAGLYEGISRSILRSKRAVDEEAAKAREAA